MKGIKAMNRNIGKPNAVYIHIPFCKHKCYYCDFNTYAVQGQPVAEYMQALDREMELTLKAQPAPLIETIFVGGGTPTILDCDQMKSFLASVNGHFPHRSDQLEFTMEANPGTTDRDKLKVMREGGVNRLSFGVQSFDNNLLKEIGRIHLVDDVHQSIENAREAGFDNISIDLMFGLPKQTLAQVEHSVKQALALNLEHYSLYGLKVEENTLFHTLYMRNELPLPDEDIELEMYLLIMNMLKDAGYVHYEISNFAKAGYESRHNSAYWRNQSYYGFGAGAHGYVDGTRHVNIKGVREYIEAARTGRPLLETHSVDDQEAMEDFMMVGLRLLSGVHPAEFRRQFNHSMEDVFGATLQSLQARGLLEQIDGSYRLSREGLLFGNEVFAEFI